MAWLQSKQHGGGVGPRRDALRLQPPDVPRRLGVVRHAADPLVRLPRMQVDLRSMERRRDQLRAERVR